MFLQMFWLMVFQLMFFFSGTNLQHSPVDLKCHRVRTKFFNNYWATFFYGTTGCEVLNEKGEECGICGFPYGATGENNVCNHNRFLWKYDYYKKQEGNKVQQFCTMMDHCKMSYAIENAQNKQLAEGKKKTNFVNYICGTETRDGKRIQKGKCWSVYGTYVCECKPPNQGKDCNDAWAPDGAYATGVQVLLDTRVRVSDNMPILIAVKDEGHDFKVHVNLFHLDNKGPTITITEPTVVDRWSTKLIKHCEASFINNEYLLKQCSTYLKGSSSIYSINLRFRFERDDNSSLWYYNNNGEQGITPIGYYKSFTVTTTNAVGNKEKVSFVRTNYDPAYNIFVEYPVEFMGCFENPKIDNCKELQRKVNIYDASTVIVLYGSNLYKHVHEVNKQECSRPTTLITKKTIKWRLSKVMPDGNFLTVEELHSESELEFVIKPYSFKNGIYMVEFSYLMLTKLFEERENFDQCFFEVVEAPLIAIIAGGRSRYVDVDTVVILDGSGSYDPNLPEKKSREGLRFEWYCTKSQTSEKCLEDYMSPKISSRSFIKLPLSILEGQLEYKISLYVIKSGKRAAYTVQTLYTGQNGNVKSLGIICINCKEGIIANPTDFIYLLVKVVLKPHAKISSHLYFIWTFSPPINSSTDSIRVNGTSQDLLKIDKNKLEHNKTYSFRAALLENLLIFSEIDIHVPFINNFTCSITPDTGIVAVTDFGLNCSKSSLTFEVYDKSSSDPDYYSGRMLYTDLNSTDNFKLANQKLVVYGYNDYKMIQKWVHDVNLTPFHGNLKDIDDMVLKLHEITKTYNQNRLHSASVISTVLKPDMDWSSISLLKKLISLVYQVKFEAMQYTKLVLSSIENILAVMSERDGKSKIKVEEAKKSADVILALAEDLFSRVKNFNNEKTLTEAILYQMIRSHLNVIEIVLTVRSFEVLSKPLHLLSPHVLRSVKDTTFQLVEALYKLSSCLLWRQIQGDSGKEIVSTASKITEWAIVHYPEELIRLRRRNENIPFNFSSGLYQIMKNLDVLGIQVTRLEINPFWWAGGDINTNILLVDICFKVNPTKCRYRRKFYTAPIFLYFNISQIQKAIKPLEVHTVYLNFTKHPRDLDMDITVYRFDPPLRAKLFIQFEFINSTEDYKVLFSINRRPDYLLMKERGITVNNENQSQVKFFYKYYKDDRDKLYYMGIFPIQERSTETRAKFKLTIAYAVCKTWLRLKWDSQRCWVGEQETNETLRCDCNHLSIFAGTVQVPPYSFNPAIEFILFLTEEFNWLPLIVLIIILSVFVILYVWGWQEDTTDSTKGLITVLQDNYPGERYGYLLGIYTGSRINASTDANVGIRLFGEEDASRAHILKHIDRPTFRGNTDDWFVLYSPEHLGTLTKTHIWHDNSGNSPDWYVEKLEVYDLTDKLKYMFELNIWLALELHEYPEVEVATSSIEDFYSVRRVILSNLLSGFRDNHYWSSIFWKQARNPIKRVLRISVVFCYIMVAFTSSVLVYHFNKGEEYEEDDPTYELNDADFIIFIITLLVASFTACIVMFLFRKSFSHKYMRMQSSLFLRPEVTSKRSLAYFATNQTDNISQISQSLARISVMSLYDSTNPRFIKLSNLRFDEKYISFGHHSKAVADKSMYERLAAAIHSIVRGSTLEPVRLPKYRKNLILHKKYFITAWTLFLAVIIGSAVIIVFFGHRVPKVEGEKWVTIVLCVILFDTVVLSTLKILLCSIILGIVFQRLVPAFNYQIKPEDGMNRRLFGDVDHLYKLSLLRSHPMYCPLHGKLKEVDKIRCVRRHQWKELIHFVVLLLLIFVLVMIIFSITSRIYSSNVHAAWMLTKGAPFDYHNFTSIYNRTTYSDFLLHNFVDRLHRYLWYTQEDALNENDHMSKNSWTYDCTTRLLGNPRIRQLRVIMGECSDIHYFEEMGEYCSPPWSSRVEDTETYGSHWFIGGNEDLRRKSSAWRYTDAAHSNSSVCYGQTLTSYPSGGFIEELGFDNDDIKFALSNMFSQNWLDHMTRAVFFELTLCNVNTGLFTQVILVAEQMPTGEYLVAVKAESVTTDLSVDIWIISFSVLLIFFLIRMCVLINRRGIFNYFIDVISAFEGFLLSLGFLTLFFYLKHITFSYDYVQEFQRSGVNQFFIFSNLTYYLICTRTVLCIFFTSVFIRMLISLRFGRIYFTFYYTFFLSIPWIVWLVLYFNLCLVVVRRLVGYLLSMFVFSYNNNYLIMHHKNPYASECENIYCKYLLIQMCLLSYLVCSVFVALFAYYYKLAKVYKFLSTENLNYFMFLKEVICTQGSQNKET